MIARNQGELAERAMLALGLTLLGGYLGWRLHSEHKGIEAAERARLADQGRIIDENLGHQMDAVDSALAKLQADLAGPRARGGAGRVNQRLRDLAGSMPGVRTLFAVDGKGIVTASNREELIGQDCRGRAYFLVARQSGDPSVLHVSPPIRNHLGTYSINLERSTSGPGGAFAGLVAATLDPDYFTTLLNSVNYAPDMRASLIHEDGTLFVMVPGTTILPGTAMTRPGSMFSQHMASGLTATVLTGRAQADGTRRMVARRTVRPVRLHMDADLVIAVGRDVTAIFSPWRRDLWEQAGFFALLALASGGGLLGFQTWRRRVAAERDLDREQMRMLVREKEIILANANVGISLMVGRQQVWVNRWQVEVFQYPREELEGRTTRMLYPSQEAYDALGRAAYPVLARGETYETVQELVRKDGQRLWIHYNGKAVEPSEPARGTLWILSDVTASKAIGDALRESEARFRSMFESHAAVMLLVDPEDGRIVGANPAAAGFYGYPAEQLKSMTIQEINSGSSEQVGKGFQGLDRGDANWFLFRHRMADGAVRTVEVMSSPVAYGGRRILFSIVMDVTERVGFERELALRQCELEELNRTLEVRVAEAVAQLREQDQILMTQSRQAALGEMIGNIAHQWRQPLNALSMVLINLKDARQCGDLDQASFEAALGKGNQLIQKMSSTINDFRDFFRPDKQNVRFSALEQVRTAVDLLDAAFAARGIAIEVAASADLPLYGLPNEFSQVLVNLLGNARQAIQDTGREDGRIVITLGEQEGCGCLRISDNGGGVPEQYLERIFEPYFSTRPSGTGIGLYMSRQIVEQSLEGRILARNTRDGAEFTVFVPLAGDPP